METYLTRMDSIARQIREGEGDESLGDKVLASAIMTELPTSFTQWIYMKSTDDQLTLEKLLKDLRVIDKFEQQRRWNDGDMMDHSHSFLITHRHMYDQRRYGNERENSHGASKRVRESDHLASTRK